MTTPIKIAIGLGTIGAVGGATYAGVHYLSPNLQISKLINEEYKHLLLNTETNVDDEHWKTNWTNYKEQKNNVFNLAGWKDNDTSLDLTKELKQKCADLKNSYVYSSKDDLYQNVTKYCGRWVTVADEARKNNLVVLDTSKGTESGGAWAKKNEIKDNLKNHLPKLDMTYDGISADKIMKGCAIAKTKDKKLSNYSDIYASYLEVCTNPS